VGDKQQARQKKGETRQKRFTSTDKGANSKKSTKQRKTTMENQTQNGEEKDDEKFQSLKHQLDLLDQENQRLAKELALKKERRLSLPEIVPGESLESMARLNVQLTETESLMANQRTSINDVQGVIRSHEGALESILNRLSEIEKKQALLETMEPEAVKEELTGLLAELYDLRKKRESLLNRQRAV